jgi:SAM-dependent methyltransferase
LNIRTFLSRKVRVALHHWRLNRLERGKNADYKAYLQEQFERSLSKSSTPLQSTLLIDRLFESVSVRPDIAVLCIGSRNTAELEYMKKKGAGNVVGIDLHSTSPDILVMDMHRMKFPDAQFDVIYSSHSLEHAYDAAQVIREIIRVAQDGAVVAIEVPIQYETRGSDRFDFESADNLLSLFAPYVNQVLVSEEHPPFSPLNRYSTPIARVVFSLRKQPA